MENHPIPQDVTGFKFKLIGSITIKQFLYLSAGVGLAFLFLMLPIFILVKLVLLIIFAGFGIALAFIPVDGRPMDRMVLNFIKSIPSENQYVYRKKGLDTPIFDDFRVIRARHTNASNQTQKDESQIKKEMLLSQLKSTHSQINPQIQPSDVDIDKTKSLFEKPIAKPTFIAQEPKIETRIISEEPSQKNAPTDLIKKEVSQDIIAPVMVELPQIERSEKESMDKITFIEKEIEETKKEERQADSNPQEIEEKIKKLQEELSSAIQEKEVFEKKYFEISKQRPNEQIFKPSAAPTVATPNVKTVAPNSSINAGFPILPDMPNIVLGIVKDPRGKVIPNIIVEITDLNNNPVRAFKTNALGQFSAATPLANGTYTVFFEDPKKQHEFDAVKIEMKGKIFSPLEIISVDQREKLRQELFERKN